jgi:hypothetical protein
MRKLLTTLAGVTLAVGLATPAVAHGKTDEKTPVDAAL